VNAFIERLRLRDLFRVTLITAQKERDRRQEIFGGELAWVIYERETMLNAVNRARAAYGKQPLPPAAVERVEGLATGHVDYTDKFALYCTELVQDTP